MKRPFRVEQSFRWDTDGKHQCVPRALDQEWEKGRIALFPPCLVLTTGKARAVIQKRRKVCLLSSGKLHASTNKTRHASKRCMVEFRVVHSDVSPTGKHSATHLDVSWLLCKDEQSQSRLQRPSRALALFRLVSNPTWMTCAEAMVWPAESLSRLSPLSSGCVRVEVGERDYGCGFERSGPKLLWLYLHFCVGRRQTLTALMDEKSVSLDSPYQNPVLQIGSSAPAHTAGHFLCSATQISTGQPEHCQAWQRCWHIKVRRSLIHRFGC